MDSYRRDGLVFDVRDSGPADGEPVVLLHGFPQDATAFDRVTPALNAAGFRTLAPDQRGYSPGARPPGRAAYRLAETAGDVLALLDAAGLQRAHLVGHDWGGAVGWALGAGRPERLHTLSVLSTPHPAALARALWTSDQALRSSYMALFQLPVLPERVLLAGHGVVLRSLLVRGGLPVEVAERYASRLAEPGALTAALAWYRALPMTARAPVGRVRVPTLHVWGSDDVFLGRAATEASAGHVSARYRLEVLDGVSHWIPELAADQLAKLLIGHLRSA